MDTINNCEAKSHLSRLLGRVARRIGFVIAKAGRPAAELSPLNTEDVVPMRRLGFMAGVFTMPDDFRTMDAGKIAADWDVHIQHHAAEAAARAQGESAAAQITAAAAGHTLGNVTIRALRDERRRA